MSGPYIYVNLSSIAPVGIPTKAQVVYNEFRSVPIVEDAEKWKLSIIRWQAFGLELPMFIPLLDITQIDPGIDPNTTAYKIKLSVTYGSSVTSLTLPVIWAPQYAGTTTHRGL